MKRFLRWGLLIAGLLAVALVAVSYIDAPAFYDVTRQRTNAENAITSWWGVSFPPFPFGIEVRSFKVVGDDLHFSLILTPNHQTRFGESYCLRGNDYTFSSDSDRFILNVFVPAKEGLSIAGLLREKKESERDSLIRQQVILDAELYDLLLTRTEVWYADMVLGPERKKLMDSRAEQDAAIGLLRTALAAGGANIETATTQLAYGVFYVDPDIKEISSLLVCTGD